MTDLLTDRYPLDDIGRACRDAGEGARTDTSLVKVAIAPHA